MLKKNPWLLLLFLIFFFFSCEEKIRESSEKRMLSYRIEAELNGLDADIVGVIDETEHVIVFFSDIPYDKDLIATFEAIGTVFCNETLQVSGVTANNYASELIYTVQAEDGSKQEYELKIAPCLSGAITSYSLCLNVNGENLSIPGRFSDDSTKIVVEAPLYWIENIGSAIATFKARGVVTVGKAEQISGKSPNSFLRDLIYTVVGEDGLERFYTVTLEAPQSTGLPVIKIDTENGLEVVDRENYIGADFLLQNSSHPEYDLRGRVGIRGRGNTSWFYSKKPYRLKFETKTSLFGFDAAKSWVLLANYQDPTFIMNSIAFELGRRLGLEYTNHENHVELFLNGQYRGSYVLTEQVQVNKGRVNIDEKVGFLVEFDSYYDEDFKFKSGILNLPVNVKSPELKKEEEMAFIVKAINDLEESLFAPFYNFPENRKYAELIDVPSLINYLLVNEIVRSAELYHPKSVFMYKDVQGKIKMGPLWDFDWGFAYDSNAHTYFGREDVCLYYGTGNSREPSLIGSRFFCRFFEDPVFRKAFEDRWNMIKGQINMDEFVDGYQSYLYKSALQNKRKWGGATDFQEQASKAKVWLNERIRYLDAQINEVE